MNAPKPSTWIQLVLLPVLYYVGAKLSLILAVMPEVVVMLWLPNGMLLAALLHYDLRRYVYFAAGILAAEVAADYSTYSLTEALLFGAINLLEVTLAYLLLRRWRFNPAFAGPGDLAKFLVAGPIIAALVAACAAGAMHTHLRATGTPFLEFTRTWWFSDGVGLLMVTPLVLSLWPPTSGAVGARPPWHWFDAVAAVLALGMVVAFLLSENGMVHGVRIRPVELLPFALYAAARLTPRDTTVVLVGFSAVILFITKNGQQPFGALPIQETVLQTQQIVFIMSVTSLGLTSLLAQLRANTAEIEARVRDRTLELRAANEQLQKLAVTDPLTGLANRRALFEVMHREMERHRRHGHALAVIMFDIDRFKEVNDTHGHAVGDAVLTHAAAITGRIIRIGDTLARYGGEEFVLA